MKAWGWYRAYCWLAFALHGLWVALWIVILLDPQRAITLLPPADPPIPETVATLPAKVFIATGLFFGVGSIAVLRHPKNPQGYAMHVTNLALGACSCILTPIALPLLLAFLKPQSKEWFAGPPETNSDN
jgi:hypothetical protein